MEDSGTIIWEDETVGTVTNIMFDMWYIDTDWKPNHSNGSSKFIELAFNLKSDEIIKEPSKGLVAILKYDDAPSNSHHVLVLSVEDSKIFMRSISDEVAAYADKQLLEPWLPADNADFYETKLKREVGFFHPLKWKKIRAIANRSDSDDVIFEVFNGKSKYAVVHLTCSKGNSRLSPATKFYKDWQDIYVNRILEDNKEWKAHRPDSQNT